MTHRDENEEPAVFTFEDRQKKKAQAEKEKEQVEAEKLRNSYLKRTGRTEMKP